MAAGSARAMTAVLRRLCRNRKTTAVASAAPSSRLPCTSATDSRMNTESSRATTRETPGGRAGLSSSTTRRTPSATVTVLASACVYTASPTLSRPSRRVRRSGSFTASRISATSPRRTGEAPGRGRGKAAMSSTVRNSPVTRTRTSRSPCRTAPLGTFRFSRRRASWMSSTDRPRARRRSWLTSTRISRTRPPETLTAATPGTRSSRGVTTSSARRRSSYPETPPPRPRNTTGRDPTSNRRTVGAPASRGRVAFTRSTRWRTSATALSRLVPRTNSIPTTDEPSREAEITRRTWVRELTCSSMGRVIRASTSSGPAPG